MCVCMLLTCLLPFQGRGGWKEEELLEEGSLGMVEVKDLVHSLGLGLHLNIQDGQQLSLGTLEVHLRVYMGQRERRMGLLSHI